MFEECKSLTAAPELPATTLENDCYENMFNGCTSLATAPNLPATTLESYCYQNMFYGCTSLTTAPVLPATTLKWYCYGGMFSGCSSLNYVKALFTDIEPGYSYSYSECLNDWLDGVAENGTYVMSSAATYDAKVDAGVPSNWTVSLNN